MISVFSLKNGFPIFCGREFHIQMFHWVTVKVFPAQHEQHLVNNT